MRDVLGGLSLDFYRVAMKPGKPLIFGTANGVPLLGLPGNPVSTGVAALLFLVPVLRRLQGLPAENTTLAARLGAPLKANDDRTDFLRATLSTGQDGEPVATPFPRQDSAMMSRLARADALIVREPQATAAAVGDRVTVIPLSGGILSL